MQNEVLRQDEILLKDEKKIRKRWLISFLIIIPLSFVEGFSHDKGGLIFFFLPLFRLFFAWLLYHCAYKKRGTFFLGIIIFVRSILTIIYAFKDLFQFRDDWISNSGFCGDSVYRMAFAIASYFSIFILFLDFYFIFISYKLYKINKIWQKKKLLRNIEHNKDFINAP